MITGAQIRAARGFLGWSARELADASGIALQTVQRLEKHSGVPSTRAQTLADVISALEKAGVEGDRIFQVAGKGDREPLYPDDPDLPANRRISITLMPEAPVMPSDYDL